MFLDCVRLGGVSLPNREELVTFFFSPSFLFATKLIHIRAGGMDTDLPDIQYWSLRLAAETPGLHNSSVVRGPCSLQTQESVYA